MNFHYLPTPHRNWLQQRADDLLRKHRGYKDPEMVTGEVTFLVCPICGHTRWQSTTLTGPERIPAKVLVLDYPEHVSCQRCHDAQLQAPDVYLWVMGMHRMLSARLDSHLCEDYERYGHSVDVDSVPCDGNSVQATIYEQDLLAEGTPVPKTVAEGES